MKPETKVRVIPIIIQRQITGYKQKYNLKMQKCILYTFSKGLMHLVYLLLTNNGTLTRLYNHLPNNTEIITYSIH